MLAGASRLQESNADASLFLIVSGGAAGDDYNAGADLDFSPRPRLLPPSPLNLSARAGLPEPFRVAARRW